jgi:hypothetical protein
MESDIAWEFERRERARREREENFHAAGVIPDNLFIGPGGVPGERGRWWYGDVESFRRAVKNPTASMLRLGLGRGSRLERTVRCRKCGDALTPGAEYAKHYAACAGPVAA